MAAPCLPSASQAPTLSLLCAALVGASSHVSAASPRHRGSDTWMATPAWHSAHKFSACNSAARFTLSPSLFNQRFFRSLRLWQSQLGTLSASHSSSAPGLFEAPVNLSVIRTFSYTPHTSFGRLHLCTPHWTVLAELSPALLPKSTAWLTASLPPTL